MTNISTHPIGIFDSGVGGLTVTHAVNKLLPNENIIYFGDTAHEPYGDKSTAAIQAYAIKICDMLLQQNCKLILIACNSASAAAYDLVKEYVGNRTKVMNVVDPVINYIRKHYHDTSIGLIGTKKTVNSNIYNKKIEALNLNIQLQAVATPLLAPAIEEGSIDDEIATSIINKYLANPKLTDISALVLGCTHYPLIKPLIKKFYNHELEILDSSKIAAHAVQGLLELHHLLNTEPQQTFKFYVSDYTDEFEAATKLFFQHKIHLEHYPLWE